MYTTLAKHVIYPLADVALRTNATRYLDALEETQWWPYERLMELQNHKLRSLVEHAYSSVPYYRRVLDERGLLPGDIRSIEDLPKLPVLTKDLIRQHFDELTADNLKRWRPLLDSSSGSTGNPLRYYITMDAVSMAWAGVYRSWRWAGYELGDKRVTLAGTSLVPGESPPLKKRIRWFLERDMRLSAVDMDSGSMSTYAGKVRRYQPRFIRGYPSAIFAFADHLRRNGVTDIKPEAVFCTAEMLLPHYRDAIEKQFGCRVFDQYGAYDGGVQAAECSTHEGYHMSVEKVVMELVGEDGTPVPPGSAGEILATDLHNYAMPFIRYAVGDRAVLGSSPCSCGRSLPLIKSLEGRTTDIIRFDNGIILSGPAVTLIFKDCNIKQYQVVQTAGSSLLVKVVKGELYRQSDTDHFTRVIRSHVGPDVEIAVEFVDDIATTKAGKHRFIVASSPG
jgi:phenylacetate-CoA ligase